MIKPGYSSSFAKAQPIRTVFAHHVVTFTASDGVGNPSVITVLTEEGQWANRLGLSEPNITHLKKQRK